jgi:esterase FrsA
MQNHRLKELGLSWTGRPLDAGPLPAFFYFALSAEESLHTQPYCQPVHTLQNTSFRCFSLDLPFHTGQQNPNQAIIEWAANQNATHPFIRKCVQAVDTLFDSQLINADHLYCGGLSRGGYAALHLAAADPRFKAVVGFAPLTSFSDEPNNLIDSLIHTEIRFYIGNRDERVSTAKAFHFLQELTEAKYRNGERSPKTEMIMTPSIGHKGHGTTPGTFTDGAHWLLRKIL